MGGSIRVWINCIELRFDHVLFEVLHGLNQQILELGQDRCVEIREFQHAIDQTECQTSAIVAGLFDQALSTQCIGF